MIKPDDEKPFNKLFALSGELLPAALISSTYKIQKADIFSFAGMLMAIGNWRTVADCYFFQTDYCKPAIVGTSYFWMI